MFGRRRVSHATFTASPAGVCAVYRRKRSSTTGEHAKEFCTPLRAWAEEAFSNLVYWNKASKGGHFAAFEQPRISAEEVRRFGRLFR
jgi:hypothetical protein